MKEKNKAKKNINGLVLAGGKSSRMGYDKAEICYYKTPQYIHLANMLKAFCDDVYISSNSKPYSAFPMLYDDVNYHDIGPLAGILTAFDYEDIDWLVIAVDYPLISKIEIEKLVNSQNTLASVFFNSNTNMFEPFLGIYKQEFKAILQDNLKKNNHSLQKILQENKVEKIIPENFEVIRSINTKEEYLKFISQNGN